MGRAVTAETRPGERPRPSLAVAMYHRWRSLLFVHWAVDVDAVRPLLPPELDVDTFDGKAWLGLVPFTMPYVRVRGLPRLPGTASFHETNVRTYVRHRGGEPGVWFFSLDAASPLAVVGARAASPLLYHRAAITCERRGDDVDYRLARAWPGPVPAAMEIRYTIDASANASARVAAPGSLEEFLVERYSLYAKRRGPLVRVRVLHRPYPLESARVTHLNESLTRAAGIELAGRAPDSVLYSGGVDVEIFRPELL